MTDTDAHRTLLRTCPLCQAVCGLELTLDAADHVVGMRGDGRIRSAVDSCARRVRVRVGWTPIRTG